MIMSSVFVDFDPCWMLKRKWMDLCCLRRTNRNLNEMTKMVERNWKQHDSEQVKTEPTVVGAEIAQRRLDKTTIWLMKIVFFVGTRDLLWS